MTYVRLKQRRFQHQISYYYLKPSENIYCCRTLWQPFTHTTSCYVVNKQLEAYLNLKLFERTTRSVTLNKEWPKFLPVANRLVLDFDIAISDMAGVS